MCGGRNNESSCKPGRQCPILPEVEGLAEVAKAVQQQLSGAMAGAALGIAGMVEFVKQAHATTGERSKDLLKNAKRSSTSAIQYAIQCSLVLNAALECVSKVLTGSPHAAQNHPAVEILQDWLLKNTE